MKRTQTLQEIRKMSFENALSLWNENRLTQQEAAHLLGVCDRTFRRYLQRYEENGLDGLTDKRLTQASARKAPVDEVLALCDHYRARHLGWNVRHFYTWYRTGGGRRSYTWVKNQLQTSRLVPKVAKRGAHRKLRERSALPGMILHQDGSTHPWVPGQRWDLIATMDDATNEHYSLFFVEEEGTASSFRGVKETILSHGLFCAFYSDRGSHYWHTPEAGGKVDKKNLTQFGRALHQLGIEMIAAYSPQARGRSERAFRTHQERLVKELAYYGITTMAEANHYLREVYLPAFNVEFKEPAREQGSAFVPLLGTPIDDILCEHHERTVGRNNCVVFERLTLQIPADIYRCNYVKAKVRVHRYPGGDLAIFHGPRKLADYLPDGMLLTTVPQKEAA